MNPLHRPSALWLLALAVVCAAPCCQSTKPYKVDWEHVSEKKSKTGRIRYLMSLAGDPYVQGNEVAFTGAITTEVEVETWHLYRGTERYHKKVVTILGGKKDSTEVSYVADPRREGPEFSTKYGPQDITCERLPTGRSWIPGSPGNRGTPTIQWTLVELAAAGIGSCSGRVPTDSTGGFSIRIPRDVCATAADSLEKELTVRLTLLDVNGPDVEWKIATGMFRKAKGDVR